MQEGEVMLSQLEIEFFCVEARWTVPAMRGLDCYKQVGLVLSPLENGFDKLLLGDDLLIDLFQSADFIIEANN